MVVITVITYYPHQDFTLTNTNFSVNHVPRRLQAAIFYQIFKIPVDKPCDVYIFKITASSSQSQ